MSNLILPPLHYFTSLCIPQPSCWCPDWICLRTLACNSLAKKLRTLSPRVWSRVESPPRKNDSSCKTLSYQAANCFILAESVASIMIHLARVMQIIISLARFEMIRKPPFLSSDSFWLTNLLTIQTGCDEVNLSVTSHQSEQSEM